MDTLTLCALLRSLCAQYVRDKQPKPEIELLLEAFEAGGSANLPDLASWALQRGYQPKVVRKRLRVAARAGLHYDEARIYAAPSPQSANALTASYPHAHAGAAAPACAVADAGGSANADADARNAPARGVGSLFEFYSSSSCLNARYARPRAVALVRPEEEEEGEYLEHAAWLLETADLEFTPERLTDAAVAIYSLVSKYGSLELVKAACAAALAKGPDGGFPGWRAWYAKNGFVEYMTRETFATIVHEQGGFAAYSASVIARMDEEEGKRVSNEQVLETLTKRGLYQPKGTT